MYECICIVYTAAFGGYVKHTSLIVSECVYCSYQHAFKYWGMLSEFNKCLVWDRLSVVQYWCANRRDTSTAWRPIPQFYPFVNSRAIETITGAISYSKDRKAAYSAQKFWPAARLRHPRLTYRSNLITPSLSPICPQVSSAAFTPLQAYVTVPCNQLISYPRVSFRQAHVGSRDPAFGDLAQFVVAKASQRFSGRSDAGIWRAALMRLSPRTMRLIRFLCVSSSLKLSPWIERRGVDREHIFFMF